jgi:Domain of unknown function (DUF4276)
VKRLEVLLEGSSDVPTVREVLARRFGLIEGKDFRLYPHQGKGRIPSDILSPPAPHRRGLLDQLPAKLRGFSHLGDEACVLVLVDSDDQPCVDLLNQLTAMLVRLPKRPARVLFRIAIEEIESWLIADPNAIVAAFPKAKLARLRKVTPDAIVGAWEQLAAALSVPEREVTGSTKAYWAELIAPHLDLVNPPSPSLRKFVEGVGRHLDSGTVEAAG